MPIFETRAGDISDVVGSRVSFCTFHMVKGVKTRVAQGDEPTTIKQQVLTTFRHCS